MSKDKIIYELENHQPYRINKKNNKTNKYTNKIFFNT